MEVSVCSRLHNLCHLGIFALPTELVEYRFETAESVFLAVGVEAKNLRMESRHHGCVDEQNQNKKL